MSSHKMSKTEAVSQSALHIIDYESNFFFAFFIFALLIFLSEFIQKANSLTLLFHTKENK